MKKKWILKNYSENTMNYMSIKLHQNITFYIPKKIKEMDYKLDAFDLVVVLVCIIGMNI